MMLRGRIGWLVLCVVLVAGVSARLLISRGLDGVLAFGWSPDAAAWRLGAVASAVVAGAALSLSGLLLQGMLRNPLASPFVLGLSGGAQAAVAIAFVLSWKVGAVFPSTMQVPVGWLGAVTALLLCVAFGHSRERGLDPISLVLSGVVVAAMAGSVAALCEWMLPPGERMGLAAWSLGRIPEAPERGPLWACVALLIGTMALFQWKSSTLDALQLGDDEARSVGVHLSATRWSIVLLASALAAGATSLCGPLAFVGLVAPHMARSMLGGSHRRTVLGSVIAGAALLVLADVARSLIPVEGGRLPIGVVCALAGGPAFLLLLRRGAAGVWR